MNHIKLLDCTLRDGGYLVDKTFGDIAIHGIISGLSAANLDIIEIGFLQNEGFGEGKVVYANGADARKHVPEDKHGRIFTVLADYSRYDVTKLEPYDGRSFDAVRACFGKHERESALDFCRAIKAKGYKLFVQPMDILGYSDIELIELIRRINEIEPYCFSIVDTYGAMYIDDLSRVYSLIHHNLAETSCVGLHSHNNLQMSSSLAQEFARLTLGQRTGIIDCTVSGLGRGAGNAPTELVAQYLVKKLGGQYHIDALLDVIDVYINSIRARCEWGYSTHLFLAGTLSAHVNNLAWLAKKAGLQSKDVRGIINLLDADDRKGYDYAVLESAYLAYLETDFDDGPARRKLGEELRGRNVVVIAPGKSATGQAEDIKNYVASRGAVVISINFFHPEIRSDYLYLNNAKRYAYIRDDGRFAKTRKIITSNIAAEQTEGETAYILSFRKLLKPGWENLDNSTILLLRLLDAMDVASIAIAGLDGFGGEPIVSQYANEDLAVHLSSEDALKADREIQGMLGDFMKTRKSTFEISFITRTRFTLD